MNRNFRLSVALDVDDLLMSCTEYAIQLANEKYHYDPPITIYEASGWGKLGKRVDVVHEFFGKAEFYETMPVLEGAKEFVSKLSEMAEIFISTAVPPEFMGIRAKRIMEEFPEIPPENIYMGSRKDKLNVDILFDDGMHNVINSNAAYPILMRRPWNQSATGMLAVNNYDEFLKLVEVITTSYSAVKDDYKNPAIVALVGPSGSGKTKIAAKLLEKRNDFEKLLSYTTIDPTAKSEDEWYNYVDKKEFFKMLDKKELFESTMYAGHGFGSKKSDVDAILASGKRVLAIMDICGAMSLKTHFKNVTTVYIKRDKKALMTNILKKNCSIQDKVNRLTAIEYADKNSALCDYIISFDNYDDAVKQLKDILIKPKKK